MAHPAPHRSPPPPRRKKAAEAEGGHERWLVSYADMITLLFALFIVLYAMSKLNESKFQQLSNSLAKAITHEDNAILPGTVPAIENDEQGKVLAVGNDMSRNVKPPTTDEAAEEGPPGRDEVKQTSEQAGEALSAAQQEERDLQRLALDIEKEARRAGLSDAVTTVVENEGLVIRIHHDRILFELGDATVAPSGLRIVRLIGTVLRNVRNPVRVEGYTDSTPLLPGARFKSNWELSAVRATNVAEILIRDIGLSPHRVTVMGHGEFKPAVPNSSASNRQLNRRVELCVLRKYH